MDILLSVVLLPCLYYIWRSIYYPVIALISIRLLQRIYGYSLLENRVLIICYAVGIRIVITTFTKDYQYFYSTLYGFGTEILWSCSEYFTVFHAVAPADRILIIHALLVLPYEWLSLLTSNYFPSLCPSLPIITETFNSSTFFTSSNVTLTKEIFQPLLDAVYSTQINTDTTMESIILHINFVLLGGLATIILFSLPLFVFVARIDPFIPPPTTTIAVSNTHSTSATDTPQYNFFSRMLITLYFVLICGTVIIGIEYNYLYIYLQTEPFRFVVERLIRYSFSHTVFIGYLGFTLALLITVISPFVTRYILNYPFTVVPSSLSLLKNDKLHIYKILLVRKIFHFGAVLMFIPGIGLLTNNVTLLYFFSFTLAVAVKVLVLLECIRILRIGPSLLWLTIDKYMRQYLDQRDQGIFILSHLYLLLGCAVPVWLTLSFRQKERSIGIATNESFLSPFLILLSLTGILSIGIGDAFAAVIGIVRQLTVLRPFYWGNIVRYTLETILGPDEEDDIPTNTGTKEETNSDTVVSSSSSSTPSFSIYTYIDTWSGARKTVEGTLAFMITYILVAVLHLSIGYCMNVINISSTMMIPLFVTLTMVAGICAFIETCAGGSDNLVVPLVAWLLSYSSIYLIFHQTI